MKRDLLSESEEKTAPEAQFQDAWHKVNERVRDWCGTPLIRVHDANAAIFRSIHRFRAADRASLLSLARDIARLTADAIDIGALRNVVAPPRDTSWRSLKNLEQALASVTDAARSRANLTALIGIYELSLGDAHLPSGRLKEAYELVGIDDAACPTAQAVQLITAAATSLEQIVDDPSEHCSTNGTEPGLGGRQGAQRPRTRGGCDKG